MEKKNASRFGFFVAFGFVLIAFVVYFFFLQKQYHYVVDNSSAKGFYFQLNKNRKEYIAAGDRLLVDLKKGKNSICIWNEKNDLICDSIFQVHKEQGLVNIARENYVIHTIYYGVHNKDSLAGKHSFFIDGKKYATDAKKIKALYTENFYYNVQEENDPVIKKVQNLETRSKIFREIDFINDHRN